MPEVQAETVARAARQRRAWTVPLGALGLWVFLAACQPTPEELWAKAQAATREGQPRTAAIYLKSLLQVQPDNAAARAALGRAEFALGDPAGAAKELRRALDLGARDPELRLALVEALLAQRDYGEALATLGEMPDAAGVDYRVLMLAGRAHQGAGDGARAEARFRGAMAAAPGNVAPVVATAALLLATGRTAEGDALVDAALALDGGSVPALVLRGRRLAEQQGPAAAAGFLSDVLAKATTPADQADVLAPLAEAAFAAGDPEAAARSVARLRELAPRDPLARYLGARLQAESGDYAGAILGLQRLLRDVPDFFAAERLLGTVHYLDGNLEQAAMHLARVMGSGDADPFLVRLLAELRMRQNRPEEALQALLPIIRQGPGAVFDQRLLVLAGQASLRLGDSGAAIGYFQQGRAANPDDPRLRLGEISARLASGDVATARAMLDRMPATPQTRLAVEYLSVMACLLDGRLGEAQAIADRLAAGNAQAPWAQLLAATVHLWQGQLPAARRGFDAALRLDPRNREALINLARLDLQEGAPGATERLRQAIAAEPGDFRPRIMLAEAELAAGRPESALAEGRAAVKFAPDAPEALNLLGRMAGAAGHWDEAREAFQRITILDARNARAWLNLARVEVAAGRPAASAVALDAALGLSRNDPAVLLAAGDVLLDMDRATEAGALFERAFVASPGAPAAMRACRARLVADPRAPCDLLAAWVKRHPEDVPARLFKASVHRARGETPAAAAEYEAVLAGAPAEPVALNNLAWIYFELGDARAAATAQKALDAAPRSAEAMDTLGWIHLHQGDRPRGLKLIAEAARGSPADPEIQYHLAMALRETGDVAGARRTLLQLLAAAPAFPSRDAAEQLLQSIGGQGTGADG